MKFWGKTTQDAIRSGLEELHKTKAQVEVKVISEGRKGFLGFGKKPAEVELVVKEETTHKNAGRPHAKKVAVAKQKVEDWEKYLHELGLLFGRCHTEDGDQDNDRCGGGKTGRDL